MTYLAVPISAKNVSQAAEQMQTASGAGAEMLELRTDCIENLDTAKLDQLLSIEIRKTLPVIVTCRDKAEGGRADLSPELRTEILTHAIRSGAEYVDCEYDNYKIPQIRKQIDEALTASGKTRLILSAHNFQGPFDDLAGLYREITQTCPNAVPKLVYKANHINHCFQAFDLLKNKTGDAIVLCMGQDGMISRILAKKFGSLVTFASLTSEDATAPGQVTIQKCKKLYRWDRIDAHTKVYGVIGNPVAHSMSPAIFNACYEEQSKNDLYLPILLKGQYPAFEEFMTNVEDRQQVFGGFSVTIPHKAHALDYADRSGDHVESLAAEIGAVNTLKVGFNGLVSAYNTDYAGAMDALTSAMGIDKHRLHNKKTAVIGAGGAARAIVAGLKDVGADIYIYNRTVEKAKWLAEEFGGRYGPLDEAPGENAEIVINCTSIGMHPDVDRSPVGGDRINPGMVVFDTVYNPLRTKLLQLAEEAGAKTVSGVEMFIRQAMAQYRIFTGGIAEEDLMRKTVLENL